MSTTPDRIADLAALVAAKIPGLFAEAHDKISDAITIAMEDSQEASDAGKDKKALLKLSISVAWDLDGTGVVVELPVNTRRKFTSVCNLEDHNQPALPGVAEA